MSASVILSLVFHNHQPVGQFDYVNEHAAHVSYLPVIELLEQHPTIHVGMHFSGHLLDWLVQNYANLVDRLRALVARGQVELLTGGYYEPVLVALPDADKAGQIEKLTERLRTRFGTTARGAWLAAKVWEPHLPRVLAESGAEYTILSDTQFESAGLDAAQDCFGYYRTEESGACIYVFPSLTRVQEAIPWQPVERLIAWLRTEADEPLTSNQPKVVCCAFDGEKFGMWPGTYERCWGDGKFMEALFAALERQSDWLTTAAPGEVLNRVPALGRVYIPESTGAEMREWSMKPEAARLRRQIAVSLRNGAGRLLQGGTWRGYLTHYDEINHLHKRMVAVSEKIHAMRRGRKREEALNMLWAAQTSDGYLHGVFGGIYLFKLRAAAYANLLAAEALADGEHGELRVTSYDLDVDGRPEIMLTSQPLAGVWTAGVGGALVELDYGPAAYNLSNIMSRHAQAYHADLQDAVRTGRVLTPESPAYHETDLRTPGIIRAREAGLERAIVMDWHRRASFIDHFLREDTTLDEFYRARYAEQGDYVNQPYRVDLKHNSRAARITFSRDGHVWIGSKHQPVSVSKTFAFEKGADSFSVGYTLSHPGAVPLALRFGVETVLGFDGGDDAAYCDFRVNSDPVPHSLSAIQIIDGVDRYSAESRIRALCVTTEMSEPAALWTFPLESVSLSDDGFERGYQGTVFLHLWEITIPPDTAWNVQITQTVRLLPGGAR